MKKIIQSIIEQNTALLGIHPIVEKMNVGFTNTVYKVNDKFIIKICTDENNEEKFKKEIQFYKENINHDLIPKLYVANIDKKEVPYLYEILEKVEGITLYNVWHTFNESQRETVIRQLCEAMKEFHSHKGERYDWYEKTRNLFLNYYTQAKQLNLFTEEERDIINNAYSKFEPYLKSDEFVLVHNDLHFDNILYHDGKIKLIDFERSLYAPKDFELDILYRMIRKPWKFASEETEKYTKLSDYENIMEYIEKYYPELIHIDYLFQRLAIYDMVYYLKQYINYPSIMELKEDILNAAKMLYYN